MKYLCENIQGCVLGYTQSDEITLVLTDYKKFTSEPWFDYEVQKMCSIAAGLATLEFNRKMQMYSRTYADTASDEKEEKQALEEEQYAEEYPKKNDFSEMEYEEESQQDGYDGESIRVNTDWLYDYEEQERKRQERMQPEESSAGQDYKDESGKIVPMKRETTGITLMKLDANHRVMARYRVNKIPFTIGRSTSNDLVLDDLCVARNHCRIIERDGRYLLEDVGTMNKLYVNGMVTGQVPLSDGLRVYIGNEEFQIAVEGGRSQSTRLYKNAEGSYE